MHLLLKLFLASLILINPMRLVDASEQNLCVTLCLNDV